MKVWAAYDGGPVRPFHLNRQSCWIIQQGNKLSAVTVDMETVIPRSGSEQYVYRNLIDSMGIEVREVGSLDTNLMDPALQVDEGL